ncbi:MAG TPA: bacteriohopanetetrol glucosamine biosynthesis glycosyltransferase HpnI [Terriglobales bacterium]|jgi:ceramide glucosyltransferase|nr:bacteriohopanetetrol glucosamine biosynthesis glycosyltransferase HpnI [Terriglobales bacterium]
MVHSILKVCTAVCVLATFGGFFYTLISLWGAVQFLWQRKAWATGDLPAVSLLKPLKGIDPEMLACLRSHCVQDYPEYEIVFGVSEAGDPAMAAVEQLKTEFPSLEITLVLCEKRIGANTKVSTLAQMVPLARHEYFVVNDSDIQVSRDYLHRVLAPLANPTIGLVTCLYRGVPAATLGSWLESLGIVEFASGVLAARLLERGIRFGLGSTLVFRRAGLAAIGGFDAFADYLADDYQLGHRLAAGGSVVELSHTVVETFLPPYSLSGFVSHQLRWARTVRDSRRWGYAGMVVTHYLPWALLALMFSGGSGWAWFLVAAAFVIRATSTLAVGRGVLNDRRTFWYLPLIPLRDLLAGVVWIGGCFGHIVKWRGERFSLRHGRLKKIV